MTVPLCLMVMNAVVEEDSGDHDVRVRDDLYITESKDPVFMIKKKQ